MAATDDSDRFLDAMARALLYAIGRPVTAPPDLNYKKIFLDDSKVGDRGVSGPEGGLHVHDVGLSKALG